MIDIFITDDLPALAAQAQRGTHTAMTAWAVIFSLVLAYELFALATDRDTLSDGVRNGPTWFKVSIGIGLCALLVHLFT